MHALSRREALRMIGSASLLASTAIATPSFATRSVATDWSEAIIASTTARIPDPTKLGNWGYAVALYLYGMYLVAKRAKKPEYLTYIRGWIDHHVDDAGVLDHSITALDYMLPGNLLLALYRETNQAKYRTAAETIRRTFDTYPRTDDGGLWHAHSRQHQLWLDGMYMSMPFLVRYGEQFHDSAYAYDEEAKQLLIYAKHLNDPASGLMFHAYDESGAQHWADPVTHHSAVFWCRSIGWFGMALIEVLETMPHSHPRRGELIALVQQLCTAHRKYQDPATGLWYQVVDRGSDPQNWLETSSSCMFTYTLSKAVARGYIPRAFNAIACKGYRGVLTQLSKDGDGQAHIANICEGTNVADLPYYYGRKRLQDDFHGLGAFLIMNEQMRTASC